MKRFMRSFAAIMVLGTAAVTSSTDANADTLDPAHVPADAKWVIHVDYEAMSESQLFETIREKRPQVTQAISGWLESRYGIDPSQDLHSITMFSRDYRRYTGTIVMQTDYQPDKIEAVLRKEKDYRTSQFEGKTLHTVTLSKQQQPGPSGDETMTVVMQDGNTLIVASSRETAQATIQLLSGEAASLAGKRSALLSDDVSTSWLYGAAIDLQELSDHPISMPVLSQHQRITWSMGSHSDGKLYERADLVAQNEQVAEHMEKVLEGLVAYETLWANGSPATTSLVKNVEVTRNGDTVRFQWMGETQALLTALGDIAQRYESWKPILMRRAKNQQ